MFFSLDIPDVADDTPEIDDSPVGSTSGFDGMNRTGEGDDGTPHLGEKKGDADASPCGFNGMNGTGEGDDDNELNQSMYLVLMFDYNFCVSISHFFSLDIPDVADDTPAIDDTPVALNTCMLSSDRPPAAVMDNNTSEACNGNDEVGSNKEEKESTMDPGM
jgi:hypothetical protein